MFASLLQPILAAIYPVQIEEVRHSTQKELRIIDTLEPMLNQHRLVLDYSAIKRDIDKALADTTDLGYSLIHQLTHITKDRGSLQHDDRLDALTIGVSYWNEKGILKQDTKKALESYRQKQLEKELERRRDVFIKHQNKIRGKVGGNISKSLGKLKAFKNT